MTDQTETDRRERYAAALYATLEVSPTRHPWETLSPLRRAVWYARADAAMKLAGEELQQERERLFVPLHRAEADNARLRAVSAAVPVPATDQAAEPLCVCGHPMRLHHEDVCLTECGCNDGLEADATDLPDRLAATLTARFTERGNPFAEMRRHEQGPDGWPASHPVGPRHVAEVLRELLAAEARATAVLPAPADRAAVLREAADIADRLMDERYGPDCAYAIGGGDVANELRRMADETPQPETAKDDYEQTTGHLITCFTVAGGNPDPDCPCVNAHAVVQQPKEA